MWLGPQLRKITSVKRVSHINLNCTTVSYTPMEIPDASCSESKVTSSHNRMTAEVGVLDDFKMLAGKKPKSACQDKLLHL